MCLGLVVRPKLMRAHARGGKLGFSVRVIGVRVRRSLVVSSMDEGACACVDSQSPATGYWARCVLSARGRGCQVRVRVGVRVRVCLALW